MVDLRNGRSRFVASTARAAITVAAAASANIVFAGPPYITDDPEPTETGHWEIYTFGGGTKTAGSFDGSAGVDLNYGAVPDIQLTATLPIEFARSSGATRTGAGNLEVGVKYRFYQNAATGVSVAMFPRVFFPTASRGFGSGRTGLLLPVWAQKDAGDWSLFGGGGYSINPGSGNRNSWQGSVAVTRALGERASFGAEIAHNSSDTVGARSYTALNFGGIYRIGGPFAILASAGPGIGHRRDGGKYNLYVALATAF